MKVKYLIKILEKLDPNLNVAVPHGFRWTWVDKIELTNQPEIHYPTQQYVRIYGKETFK